jgi:hypothetical protein
MCRNREAAYLSGPCKYLGISPTTTYPPLFIFIRTATESGVERDLAISDSGPLVENEDCSSHSPRQLTTHTSPAHFKIIISPISKYEATLRAHWDVLCPPCGDKDSMAPLSHFLQTSLVALQQRQQRPLDFVLLLLAKLQVIQSP